MPGMTIMKLALTLLTIVLVVPLAAPAEPVAAQGNFVSDPGFEEQPVAGRAGWVGTQNAGQAVYERSTERRSTKAADCGRWRDTRSSASAGRRV